MQLQFFFVSELILHKYSVEGFLCVCLCVSLCVCLCWCLRVCLSVLVCVRLSVLVCVSVLHLSLRPCSLVRASARLCARASVWARVSMFSAGASLCTGTLSTRCSEKSSDHSGRSRNGFLRPLSWSFYLFLRFLLVHAMGISVLCYTYSHFSLIRDAVQESRLPAILMSEIEK